MLSRSNSTLWERRQAEIETLQIESDNNLIVLVLPSASEPGSFTVRVFPNIGTEEGQCNIAYCSVLLRVDYGFKENQTNFALV